MTAAVDIYLVRHGEAATRWGESDDPGLSELGRQQALAVCDELLQRVDTDAVSLISSPLARARETALPLAEALTAEVAISDAFREIPAPVPVSQRQEWLRGFIQQRWEQQPLSLYQWRQKAVDELLHADGPRVVFSHFMVINAVVGRALGSDETLCFRPDNASITQLRLTGGELQLVDLGREMETAIN